MNQQNLGNRSWMQKLKPLSLCVIFAVSGCWFDSGSSKHTNENNLSKESGQKEDTQNQVVTTKLTGTVAIGFPLENMKISLNCSGYQKIDATSTDKNGQWSFDVPTQNLPCLIRAKGEDKGDVHTIYGLSLDNQPIANLTPLTTLALARATNNTVGLTLDDLFASEIIDFNKLKSGVDAAVNTLKNDLIDKDYTYPSTTGFNPFSTPFNPVKGDVYDDLLEDLKIAIEKANTNLGDLTRIYANGGELPHLITDNEKEDDNEQDETNEQDDNNEQNETDGQDENNEQDEYGIGEVEFSNEELAAKALLGGKSGIVGTSVYDGKQTPFSYLKSRTGLKYTMNLPGVSVQYDHVDNALSSATISFPTKTGTYPCAKKYNELPSKGHKTAMILFNDRSNNASLGLGSTCTVKVKVTNDVVEGSFSTNNDQSGVVKSANISGYFYHSIKDE